MIGTGQKGREEAVSGGSVARSLERRTDPLCARVASLTRGRSVEIWVEFSVRDRRVCGGDDRFRVSGRDTSETEAGNV